MEITAEELIAIHRLAATIGSEEIPGVDLMRALAAVYAMLSEAKDEDMEGIEELPSAAEYFDKAVDMSLKASAVIRKWEGKVGLLTKGLLLKAEIKPVSANKNGQLKVLVVPS